MGRLRATIILNRPPDQEVVALIEIANMCDMMGALPYAGGLFDQDHLLMRKIMMVNIARAEKRKKDNG